LNDIESVAHPDHPDDHEAGILESLEQWALIDQDNPSKDDLQAWFSHLLIDQQHKYKARSGNNIFMWTV